MLSTNVCVWTLAQARQIAGSERRLARWLQVPLSELKAWLSGKDLPPTGVFLAAVDIIQEAERQESDPDTPPSRERLHP